MGRKTIDDVGKAAGVAIKTVSRVLNNEPNVLDQFLVNRNLAEDTSPIRVRPETVEILRFPDTTASGDYPKPIPFGGMGDPVNTDGFSDHFPIGVVVTEDD